MPCRLSLEYSICITEVRLHSQKKKKKKKKKKRSPLGMTLNCIGWDSSLGDLKSVEQLFISITPRYTDLE